MEYYYSQQFKGISQYLRLILRYSNFKIYCHCSLLFFVQIIIHTERKFAFSYPHRTFNGTWMVMLLPRRLKLVLSFWLIEILEYVLNLNRVISFVEKLRLSTFSDKAYVTKIMQKIETERRTNDLISDYCVTKSDQNLFILMK